MHDRGLDAAALHDVLLMLLQHSTDVDVDRYRRSLTRFTGDHDRFAGALDRVRAGDTSWVTKVREDSCHTVWMELHEDLVATLGLERGAS